MKKLSIVIPVYNEQATILSILDKLLEVKLIGGLKKELVLVNDNSTDQSENLILSFKKPPSLGYCRFFFALFGTEI